MPNETKTIQVKAKPPAMIPVIIVGGLVFPDHCKNLQPQISILSFEYW